MGRRLTSLLLAGILALSCGSHPAETSPLGRRVILVSIDGARPDALRPTVTPTITDLWKRGAYSFRAQTVYPSTTLPSHASMLTGLSPAGHGMWSNDWKPGEPAVAVETVFNLASSHGLKTAMVVGKPKLRFLVRSGSPHFVKVIAAPAPNISPWAARILASERPHLLFIHFADADRAGHDHGWMSPQYLSALARVDKAVAALLQVLEQTELLAETVLILTADHGGHGRTHGTELAEDKTIPWIAFGVGVREGYEIPTDIKITDTAATILDILNLPIPDGWEGRPLRSIFRPRTIDR